MQVQWMLGQLMIRYVYIYAANILHLTVTANNIT